MQILLRLREPTNGHYLVNGVNVTALCRKDWETRVAYVPQDPHLIHATVADNIRYLRNIPDAEVKGPPAWLISTT